MLRLLLLATLVLSPFAGCGSIHSLAPSTAASRISSYDGYKEEACALMQDYVSVLIAMSWNDPQPVTVKPESEVEHLTAVFAGTPEVTCRVKAGKNIFDLTGRKFHQILVHFNPLQKVYATVLAKEVDQCADCQLPDYPISNNFLAEYYRQAPFPSFKAKHMELFQDMCLDNLKENESRIEVHDGHRWPPSNMNPLYPSHSGCKEARKAALQAQASRCSRYQDIPHYLICPDVVWDTRLTPPYPLGHPKRYTQNKPFSAGFVLTTSEGYDVYWQSSPGTLSHEVIRPGPGEAVKFDDFDGNNRNDFSAGGIVFLSQHTGLAKRQTVVSYQQQLNQKDSDERAQQVADREDKWHERLSLLEVEDLLATSQINNPLLLKQAVELSATWWTDKGEVSTSVREKTRIFWHAILWSKFSRSETLTEEFLTESIAALQTEPLSARLKTISLAYARGAKGTIDAECDLLQGEIKAGERIAAGIGEGTEMAEQELGAVWLQYRNEKMPSEKVASSRADFDAAVTQMAPEIKNLCKRD